jgi:hypothetical protein
LPSRSAFTLSWRNYQAVVQDAASADQLALALRQFQFPGRQRPLAFVQRLGTFFERVRQGFKPAFRVARRALDEVLAGHVASPGSFPASAARASSSTVSRHAPLHREEGSAGKAGGASPACGALSAATASRTSLREWGLS